MLRTRGCGPFDSAGGRSGGLRLVRAGRSDRLLVRRRGCGPFKNNTTPDE